MRIVRRGFTCSAFRIRMTSIATTVPAPLSVAPVAAIHESRWPPTITTSSFNRIRAGNFSDRIETMLMVAEELHIDIHFDADRHVGFQQPIHASVIFNRRHYHGKWIGVIALVGGPQKDPPSSKIVPPEPPPSRPSRLGRITANACSEARNFPVLLSRAARFMISGSLSE
jgi:hypothetical protein